LEKNVPKITLPSVKSLRIELVVGGQTLGTATGFVARSATGPVLLTNRHNVTGKRQDDDKPISKTGGIPDRVRILHNRKSRLGEWVSREETLLVAGKPRWIEHPSLGPKVDFVALPLQQVTDVELYPYDLLNTGPAVKCGPADVVSVVGFPFGLQGGGSLAIWATGFVASEPGIDLEDLPKFLIDCRSRQGQSGSAVIAYRSGGATAMEDGSTGVSGEAIRFLGIYSGRINAESDLGIVWKATALNDLVSSIK
jgi:hypothetical protein